MATSSAENVVEFNGITRLDVPPERILNRAAKAGLKRVIVIGADEDGDLFFASSFADGPENLWMMEVAKRDLLNIGAPVEDE